MVLDNIRMLLFCQRKFLGQNVGGSHIEVFQEVDFQLRRHVLAQFPV